MTLSILTVTIKDDEKTLRTKHLLYEDYSVSAEDPIIAKCIGDALKEFNSEPTDVSIKITMDI